MRRVIYSVFSQLNSQRDTHAHTLPACACACGHGGWGVNVCQMVRRAALATGDVAVPAPTGGDAHAVSKSHTHTGTRPGSRLLDLQIILNLHLNLCLRLVSVWHTWSCDCSSPQCHPHVRWWTLCNIFSWLRGLWSILVNTGRHLTWKMDSD